MSLETPEIPSLEAEQGQNVYLENTTVDKKYHDFKKLYILLVVASICCAVLISALVIYFTNKKYYVDIQSLKNENYTLSQRIDAINAAKSEKK